MRIAVFTFSYAPFLSGIATGTHLRVKTLLDQGHEVCLIHPRVDGQYPREIRDRRMSGLDELQGRAGFTSQTYPTRPHPFSPTHPEPRSFRHWSDTQLLARFAPDVIVVCEAAGMYGFSSGFLGGYRRPIGVEYARRTGVPVVALFEGNWLSLFTARPDWNLWRGAVAWRETDWLAYAQHVMSRWATLSLTRPLRPLIRRFSASYTATFYPSRELLARYQNIGSLKSEYVPFNGVDCSKFHPDCRRFDPSPGDDRTTMLSVGRLAIEKSVHELFDVLPSVRRQIPDAQLVIIGGGPEAARTRKIAARFAPHCTVVGECFGDALKGWYARADVFLNPSAAENFCTTNLEALACGTPVIAANEGGNREQVVDGSTGFLVAAHRPREMARKAIELLGSPETRQRMSLAAREFVQQFDTAECGGKLEQALLRLAPQPSHAGRRAPCLPKAA